MTIATSAVGFIARAIGFFKRSSLAQAQELAILGIYPKIFEKNEIPLTLLWLV
jgi:hypothetical protein